MAEYAVEMLNMTKRFGNLVANDDITLRIKKGEIHALLGENGAGKSTLMSTLFGIYRADSGTILINGEPAPIQNPNDANNFGIGMVHQHFKLVHNFTVLENIMLGVEPMKHGFFDPSSARTRVMDLSRQFSLPINPDSVISGITVGMQQRTEILKMLYRENDILIFDEPTAVLLPQEIDALIDIIKGLAADGKTILFISHKLEEIKRVADRCTVLRRGKTIGTVDVANTTSEEMAEMMVGRKVLLTVDKGSGPHEMGKPVLSVRSLTVYDPILKKNNVTNVSFDVRSGEIACIAGVDGNGQSELVGALTGLTKAAGIIELNGEDIGSKTVRYRNTHGLSHIPEDRQRYGLVMEYNMAYNVVLQQYFEPQFGARGILQDEAIRQYSEGLIEKYDIRSSAGVDSLAGGLSGGNQQKVILARELERPHDLVIAVQPTRGLDVGAIESVYRYLVIQRNAGKAVLLVSLELDEVMGLSDRIMVIHNGELVADDLDPKNLSLQELGLYMAGSRRSGGKHE
ncbi:heme ABC transporter ATP-binding protein [Spirochaetia bacterium]|nr:heme ABC transporter ATP-binding protein [Spirochaetia bacterium]